MADETVPVRDAATVVLLRDAADGSGLETWLLTRVRQMAFAAGMSVFPGGRVEDDDADVPLHGDVVELAARLGCAEREARAFVGAAARETFEETGVLLTVPPAPPRLAETRDAVEAGRTRFAALLDEHGLAVDTGALRPWSRWITPEGEPRRYDTRFFVGAVPDGMHPRDVTSESSTAGWVAVEQALEQGRAQERKLMPPTMITLLSVQACGSTADVLAASASRSMDPVRPVLDAGDDGTVTVRLPDGSVHVLRRPTPAG